MQYEVKQLDVMGILKQALALTKNHFVLFFTIAVLLYVPYLLLCEVVNYVIPAGEAGASFIWRALRGLLFGLPLWLLGFVVVIPLTQAALIYAVASQYLERPVKAQQAFSRAIGIFMPLALTMLLVSLAVMVGIVLLIIPGIVFALWFCLSQHVVVIEGQSGVEAMKRSKQLIDGNLATGIVLLIVVIVAVFVVRAVASFIPVHVVAAIVEIAIDAGLMVFFPCVATVFYFSCRSKAGNFDTKALAQAVGTSG